MLQFTMQHSTFNTQHVTLRAHSLSLAYRHQPVLRDLSLCLEGGVLTALIGPNGAGKTSLLRLLSGSLAPTAGQILLNERNLTQLSDAERARQIAVVPQSAQFPEGFSVGELVLMGRAPHLPRFGAEGSHDYAIAEHAMQQTDILELAQRSANELSGGERQRVLLARALTQQPRVLLLDEVTAHLDLKYQLSSLELARELAHTGLIVVAVLHDLNLAASYAERVLLIHRGQILADGSPHEVLTSERLYSVYGINALIDRHPQSGKPLIVLP